MNEKAGVLQPTSDTNSIEHRKYNRRKVAVLGGVALSLLAGLSGSEKEPAKPEVVVVTVPAPSPERTIYDAMTVIALEDPTDDIKSREDLGDLSSKFEKATEAIERTTDGYIIAPEEIPVVRVERAPDGVKSNDAGEEIACYSDDALRAVRSDVLDGEEIDSERRTPISIESDATACSPSLSMSTVAFYSRGEHEGGVYLRNTLKGEEGGETTIVHELGHEELKHSGIMSRENGTKPIRLDGDKDIGMLTESETYSFQKSSHDDIDVYANRTTAMGGITSLKGDVYNFVEQQRIHPDGVKIEDISGVKEARFEVGTNTDDTRGIVLSLPEDHPIRDAAGGEDIDKLYIGLNAKNGEGMADVELIASDKDGTTYKVQTTMFIPAIDYERGEVTLYTDASLGIQVVAESSEADVAEDSSRAMFTVRPYEPLVLEKREVIAR